MAHNAAHWRLRAPLGCLEWVRVTTAEQGDLISPEPLVLVKKPWNIRALKLNRGHLLRG